jgi:hypothetical protein
MTSDPVYDDFPACLSRYAWLVREAEKDPARLFNDHPPHSCKACGAPTNRNDWQPHVRQHARELQQSAQQRERETAKRLRAVSRLRAETRRATA